MSIEYDLVHFGPYIALLKILDLFPLQLKASQQVKTQNNKTFKSIQWENIKEIYKVSINAENF